MEKYTKDQDYIPRLNVVRGEAGEKNSLPFGKLKQLFSQLPLPTPRLNRLRD